MLQDSPNAVQDYSKKLNEHNNLKLKQKTLSLASESKNVLIEKNNKMDKAFILLDEELKNNQSPKFQKQNTFMTDFDLNNPNPTIESFHSLQKNLQTSNKNFSLQLERKNKTDIHPNTQNPTQIQSESILLKNDTPNKDLKGTTTDFRNIENSCPNNVSNRCLEEDIKLTKNKFSTKTIWEDTSMVNMVDINKL